MSEPYQADQRITEECIYNLLKRFDSEKYSGLIWNKKEDDFDYTDPNGSLAVELVSVYTSMLINIIEYEKAYDSEKRPDKNRLKGAVFSKEGRLFISPPDTSLNLIKTFKEVVDKKNKKLQRRKSNGQTYNAYELCICIPEYPLLTEITDFAFVNDSFNTASEYDTMIVITREYIYCVYDHQSILFDKHDFSVVGRHPNNN